MKTTAYIVAHKHKDGLPDLVEAVTAYVPDGWDSDDAYALYDTVEGARLRLSRVPVPARMHYAVYAVCVEILGVVE